MEHETRTAMFTILYKAFSCSKVEQICFFVPKKHSIFTEMEHETRTAMFTTLYKAFSCSKVEQRNEIRIHNHNVYNALQNFFVFQHGTAMFLCSKKTLYIHRNGTQNYKHNVYNALQDFFVFQSETPKWNTKPQTQCLQYFTRFFRVPSWNRSAVFSQENAFGGSLIYIGPVTLQKIVFLPQALRYGPDHNANA